MKDYHDGEEVKDHVGKTICHFLELLVCDSVSGKNIIYILYLFLTT